MGVVLFINFAPNHPELQKEHKDYIEQVLVPYYIDQIEASASGIDKKFYTVNQLVGHASMTGPTGHNTTLSVARAKAIGDKLVACFDQQKARGKYTRNTTLAYVHKGYGDALQRSLMGIPFGPPSSWESRSNQFRCVRAPLLVITMVSEEDEKIYCRQILNVKLEALPVPTTLLSQKIDEIEKKIPPELQLALQIFFSSIKEVAKAIAKLLLEGAEFTGPEIFIIFKAVEFAIPSDVSLLFEFKDARGRTRRYRFDGSQLQIDANAIEVFCELLSILKWMIKLPAALEKLESGLEDEKKTLNATREHLETVKKAIETAKKYSSKAKEIYDAITAPNSLFRKVIGNRLVDLLVRAVGLASTALLGDAQVATEFAQVSFVYQGLFDIYSFQGVANVETRELRGTPTSIILDFAAVANERLLGYRAHVVMQREFEFSFTIGSYATSRGNLLFAAP